MPLYFSRQSLENLPLPRIQRISLYIMDSLNRLCTGTAILLLLLLPATLPAAQKKAAPWYDIEIVLFSIADRGSSEQWPLDPGAPDTGDTVGISSFQQLPPRDWKLSAEDRALSRSRGRYRSLMHLAWRQPVLGRTRAKPIYIRSRKTLADGYPVLEGRIRVSVGRYLHLDLDLLLRDRIREADGMADFQAFRFVSSRRMRSGETHYIDHPRIGALVRIEKTPREEPSAPPATEESGPAEPQAPDAPPATAESGDRH